MNSVSRKRIAEFTSQIIFANNNYYAHKVLLQSLHYARQHISSNQSESPSIDEAIWIRDQMIYLLNHYSSVCLYSDITNILKDLRSIIESIYDIKKLQNYCSPSFNFVDYISQSSSIHYVLSNNIKKYGAIIYELKSGDINRILNTVANKISDSSIFVDLLEALLVLLETLNSMFVNYHRCQSLKLASEIQHSLRKLLVAEDENRVVSSLAITSPLIDRIESLGKGYTVAQVYSEGQYGKGRTVSLQVELSLEFIANQNRKMNPFFRVNKKALVNCWNIKTVSPIYKTLSNGKSSRSGRYNIQTTMDERDIYVEKYRAELECHNRYLRLVEREYPQVKNISSASLV